MFTMREGEGVNFVFQPFESFAVCGYEKKTNSYNANTVILRTNKARYENLTGAVQQNPLPIWAIDWFENNSSHEMRKKDHLRLMQYKSIVLNAHKIESSVEIEDWSSCEWCIEWMEDIPEIRQFSSAWMFVFENQAIT